jgi:2-polyprenyl-3-methyl-5-hydroxy-6-metoxy-1,4-benzoquinol methylase
MHVGDAMSVLVDLEPADRVLVVETIEHVDAPWALLRHAARLVRPGGIIVVTTPNIATLRHRLELPIRGELTSFRPHEIQHLTPALPHVTESVLAQEGLSNVPRTYAGRDIVPFTGGRVWPTRVAGTFPSWLNISVITAAKRPPAPVAAR